MCSIHVLLAVAAAYGSARSLSESRVSTLAFGDGTRLKHLRAGGDMGVRRVERALVWFSANWPDGADWPEGIIRPAPTDSQEAA